MISAAYKQAVFPTPPIVLGLQLQPLSAGHKLLLDHVDCLNAATEANLCLAVSICAQPYEAAKRLVTSPILGERMARFLGCLLFPKRFWLFRRRAVIDWAAEWQAFGEYYEAAHESPSFVTETKSRRGKPSGTPEIQSVKCLLIKHGICTEKEFLDRHWALSLWDYFTLLESEGIIHIQTDSQIAAFKKAKEAAERFDAKLKEAA